MVSHMTLSKKMQQKEKKHTPNQKHTHTHHILTEQATFELVSDHHCWCGSSFLTQGQ